MGGMMGFFFMMLLPGLIASKITMSKGFHPAIGFAAGFLFSWPGMVFAAVASVILSAGRSHPAPHLRRPSPHAPRRTRPATRSSRGHPRSATELKADGRAPIEARLREERRRLAELQREAEHLRRSAEAERRQSEAAVQARDDLIAAREAEIEHLRGALDSAAEEREVERDPWYRESIAPAEEALPDVLPADMPRQSFDAPSEEPRALAAGGGEGEEA